MFPFIARRLVAKLDQEETHIATVSGPGPAHTGRVHAPILITS